MGGGRVRNARDSGGKALVGWKEWVALPDLGIPCLKAKIDTGARTSALHAAFVEAFERDGQAMVRFGVHPIQRRKDRTIVCEAPVLERRKVKDSGGHGENRIVIRTPLSLGGIDSEIDLSLTDRETMLFRMIMGRTALAGLYVIDPSRSYLCGKKRERD